MTFCFNRDTIGGLLPGYVSKKILADPVAPVPIPVEGC
jgi:hypothetical protein